MEAAGIGMAVVGLAGQLFNASLMGYNLLETAQSFGKDYEDLNYQLKAEKLFLEKWAKAWVVDQNSRMTSEPDSGDYLFAVDTLARIAAVFAEVSKYNSRYNLPADRQCGPRKRDAFIERLPFFLRSPRAHSPKSPPQTTQSGVDQGIIELLNNPHLLDFDKRSSSLEKEVERLKASAESLQKALPSSSKLRWSVIDKDKFEKLIGELKRYNENLDRILPVSPKALQPRGLLEIQPTTASFTVSTELPFRRNRMFCGRDDLIDIMHLELKENASSDAGGQKVVILHGLGGIGKTSIALEYAFRYSKLYTAIFWVDVTSEMSLFQSARGIAEQIIANYLKRGFSNDQIAATMGSGILDSNGQLTSDESAGPRVTKAIKEWLAANENEEWLLVLDNHDNVDAVDIHLLLPNCDAGHVIITSRKNNLQELGKTVAVEEIDEDSGMALFLKSANKAEAKAEERERARQIAVKLGFLPLALTQAGSYISQMQISFQRYMALLDEAFKKVATRGTKNPNRTIFTTWEISFAQLSLPAQELLLLCGFLANSDIPDALFVQESKLPFEWVREGDEWLMDSLAELFSFSLAKRKASEDAFWIHPVVHNWARERLESQSKQKKAEEAVILCGRIYRQEEAKQPDNWTFERRILAHITSVQRGLKALPKTSNTGTFANGEMLFQGAVNVAEICWQHGLYSDAEHLLEWARAGQTKLLGDEHSSTLSTMNSLAIVFRNQGQYEKALEWYGRTLDGYEKTLGKDHLSTLHTVHNMAMVFDNQGQYEKALEWYGRALDGYEKTLGNDHPSTLDTVNGMAIVFNYQGQYEKALAWYGRALDGYVKTLGNDHLSTLNTVHNMAIVFDNQGQYEKALEWFGRALDGREKTLGKGHPFTLDTVNGMAMVFRNQGQYEKALEWYGRALDGREKTLGNDHPSTLNTINNMATVFNYQGQHEKALEWYGRALDGYVKTLGNDHPFILDTVHNMAIVFDNQGQYEKALEWYGRALDGREKTLGTDHPSTLRTLRSLKQAQAKLR